MECVEGALKASFQKEISMKTSPQVVFDDLWGLDVENVTTCDDFFVDELLNFSNEDGLIEEDEPEGDKAFGSVSPKKKTLNFDNSDSSSNFSLKDDFGSVPTSELNLPEEDMADLEWLSQFVDDSENSFSEFSTPYATVILPSKTKEETKTAPEPEPPALKTPVQAKIRSKRIRTGGRLWSLGATPLPVYSSSSSSSSTSSSSLSPPSRPWFIDTTTQEYEPAEAVKEKPLTKKLKKKSGSVSSGSVQPARRCSHCGVHKTPQWRAGPLGAKTLCNACGVRYKSGRLLPEYRPACSPTFSSELHSNHHRRVLEMRSKKEVVTGIPESGLSPSVVHSFDPNPN